MLPVGGIKEKVLAPARVPESKQCFLPSRTRSGRAFQRPRAIN
ncbi:MAG: hypothetical protein ACRDF6_05365 [bacterium]